MRAGYQRAPQSVKVKACAAGRQGKAGLSGSYPAYPLRLRT
jgi:hypothetical protein